MRCVGSDFRGASKPDAGQIIGIVVGRRSHTPLPRAKSSFEMKRLASVIQ
jgi:hypothetical protein